MSSEIDTNLLEQIKRHEGYKQHPYKCTAGKLTVGIGRNLDDVGILPREAEYLLMQDVQRSVAELRLAFPWYNKLERPRKQAMINLIFNIGLPTLRKFTKFLAAMEAGDYDTAHDELLDSRYARQVGRRAIELAEQIRGFSGPEAA